MKRNTVLALAFFSLCAIGFQVALLRAVASAPMSPDGAEYYHLGKNIARGEGFVTHIWNFPAAPKDRLPSAETYRDAMYPYLIALSFRLFGESVFAAAFFPLLAAATLPWLVFFLAKAMLHEQAGLMAAALAAFSPAVQGTAALPGNDILLAAFLAIFWIGVFRGNFWLVGIGGALGFLTRSPAMFAFVPGFLYLLWHFRSWRKVILAGALLLALVSPVLYRNVRDTGRPLTKDGKYLLGASYSNEDVFLFLKTPVQYRAPLEITPKKIIKVGLMWTRNVIRDGMDWIFGSTALAFLCIVGLLAGGLRKQELAVFVFFVLTISVVLLGVTFEPRYLSPFLPFALIYTGLGILAVISRAEAYKGVLWGAAVVLLLLLPAWQKVNAMRKTWPETAYVKPWFWAHEAAAVIKPELGPDDAVMASFSGYYQLALDRNIVSVIPAPDDYLKDVMRRFRVKFIVASPQELDSVLPRWKKCTPAWVEPVPGNSSVNFRILRVVPEKFETGEPCRELPPLVAPAT